MGDVLTQEYFLKLCDVYCMVGVIDAMVQYKKNGVVLHHSITAQNVVLCLTAPDTRDM